MDSTGDGGGAAGSRVMCVDVPLMLGTVWARSIDMLEDVIDIYLSLVRFGMLLAFLDT